MNRSFGRASFLVSVLLLVLSSATAQPLQIHHIDVGQGDSTLIISPTGKTLLIDAGDQGWGTDAVLPYLKQVGVKRLDYAIASHYDKDHIGGLDEVINGIGLPRIGIVYDRGALPPPPPTTLFRAYAIAANGHRKAVALGQAINLGGGVLMRCLAEDGVVLGRGAVPNAAKDENNLSVAWLLTYKHFRYFTGGDCAGMRSGTYVDLETPISTLVGRVDAMKIDHHASATSANDTLLGTMSATAAIIEVGTSSHNHPTKLALERIRDHHSVVYATEKGNGWVLPLGQEFIANEASRPTIPVRSVLLVTDGMTTFTVKCGPCITHCYPLH